MAPGPSERAVRRFYGFLTLTMAAIGLPLFAMLPLQLADRPLPVWPTDELTAYLATTGGAVALAVAWLCTGVARHPARSSIAAAPLCVLFFAFAFARYLAFFFGEAMVAQFGPGIAVEVIVFSAIGTACGLMRTDGPSPSRLVRAFAVGLPTLRPVLKAWLVVLVLVVVVGPFAFLGHRAAQALALGHALSMLGLAVASWHGTERVLGASHVFAWTVALGLMVAALPADGIYGAWLMAGTVTLGLCLLVDAADTARWLLGNRDRLFELDLG